MKQTLPYHNGFKTLSGLIHFLEFTLTLPQWDQSFCKVAFDLGIFSLHVRVLNLIFS